jgi:hypothetical protein
VEALKKMPGHTRLYRRGATYYHRAAVPQDIRDTYGKREETFSLGTKDHAEACRLVREAAVNVDRKFEAHRASLRARRRPPVIELGFLRYVEWRRRQGDGHLFPKLKRDRNGYYSDRASKDFSAYLMGDLHGGGHADKFQLHIYAALAEQERDFISKRTKAALREAKARGKTLGGLRDATLRRNEAVRANAEKRAQKLAGIILPMREAGKSMREIAAELDIVGVSTARGGSWTPSQVKRVLDRLR